MRLSPVAAAGWLPAWTATVAGRIAVIGGSIVGRKGAPALAAMPGVGLVFGQEAAQSAIVSQIAELVGEQTAAAIKDMIQRAEQPSTGLFATALAVATLLLGASGVFGQLQDALNTVWGVEPKEGSDVWAFIKARFLSFVAVLGTGFLLLVSLILSSALAAFGKWFGEFLPLPEAVLQLMNFALSFLVVTGLFALIFKVLPDAKVAWRDVWIGAALTSALFTIGKFALGLYLGKSNVASAYGAAGSLVLVLLWVYYSAQILLYGAEFTQVYANRVGERIVPTPEANVTDPHKAAADRAGQAPARAPGRAA